ncbi:glutathione S-transferase family protein [Pararhodobacter sp.]|uniref:glutathione S-transferase family protein n=1 Tax=Pararhodobacter sp. TaxID=2127056 RepID=UPI002AFF1D45|nr:glutathione S-transferase family protein [Pararhodobacter sp.]
MVLHHSPASPFVRKIVVLLDEAGQKDTVRLAPATGSPVDPGTMPLGANPLGKIPALERPDGCTLYDSRVITRFLATQVPAGSPAFYPDGPRLWEVLTLEATADGIVDAAILMRYETALRAPEKQSTAWIEGQWAKISRALDALESRWMAHLAGPLDMGQIAVGCALGYLDFRFADRNWRAQAPTLAAWYADFVQRPSMQATLPG